MFGVRNELWGGEAPPYLCLALCLCPLFSCEEVAAEEEEVMAEEEKLALGRK